MVAGFIIKSWIINELDTESILSGQMFLFVYPKKVNYASSADSI